MNALRTVFGNYSYIALAAAVSLFMLALATWFPNLRLLWAVWSDPRAPFITKAVLPVRLFESITTNFTVLSASYTIVSALLVGINVALATYILKRQKRQLAATGVTVGTLGIISGVAGLGCAACGSLIFSALLATAGGAGLIVLLPLRGGEFGIIAVALLGTSAYYLAKHISKPPVCEVIITT